jgi:hypothetical protein
LISTIKSFIVHVPAEDNIQGYFSPKAQLYKTLGCNLHIYVISYSVCL